MEDLQKQLRTMQLIVAAMMLSIIIFGAVVLLVGPRIGQDPALAKILLPVLAVLAAMEVPVYFIVRKLTINKVRSQLSQDQSGKSAEEQVLPAWFTLTLIRSAMLEGIGQFALVIILITGVKLAFVVPLIVLALFAASFPSMDRLHSFTSDLAGRNPYAG